MFWTPLPNGASAVPYNGGIVSFDEQLREALGRALADAHAQVEHDVHALADEELRRRSGERMDELARAARAFDEAESLTDVLRTLVDCAGRYADRVALLLVRNGRARWWGPVDVEGLTAHPSTTYLVTVGWRVVAVLQAEAPDPAAAATLDVLTRYSGRLLESMTLHKALGLVPPRPPAAGRLAGAGGVGAR